MPIDMSAADMLRIPDILDTFIIFIGRPDTLLYIRRLPFMTKYPPLTATKILFLVQKKDPAYREVPLLSRPQIVQFQYC